MSYRIIIIDDYAPTGALAKQVLTMRGHVCKVVDTALAAIRAMDFFEPEVAILEWSLRDGTGMGLASQLRSRSRARGSSLVVVACSALDQPSDFREDVDGYFTKPVRLHEIEQFCFTLAARVA